MTRASRSLLFVFAVAILTGADNWERFRGPNGAGTSDDRDIPLTFSATQNVVWKTALPGAGNSSPIVWGKHVFLQTSSKDGKSRSLLHLDAASGKIIWEKTIPGVSATIRADSSMASSTPTTDGQSVYVSFWDGKDIILTSYDFQGAQLWSKNLGNFNSQHGPGASLILYKDSLLLANDMDKDDFYTKKVNPRPSFLMAFDKRTGRLLWETPRTAERASYSAPIFRQLPGQKEPELVVTSATAVTGYSPSSGVKLWELKDWQVHGLKAPMRTVATPAMLGDMLCVCCGGDAGRYAIGVAMPKSRLPGAGMDTAKAVWENRKDFPYVPSPLARGEHFYFVNDAGFAGCYDAKTGKRVWFERLAEGGFHASPLLIDGKIYAVSTAGDVYVLAAEPTFKVLARNELGEVIRATPAVTAGRLYIRGDRHLYCIGKGS